MNNLLQGSMIRNQLSGINDQSRKIANFQFASFFEDPRNANKIKDFKYFGIIRDQISGINDQESIIRDQ